MYKKNIALHLPNNMKIKDTQKTSKLIVFDKNLWQSGVVACKKTRQSFTAYMNEALEEKLKREDKILSKHN